MLSFILQSLIFIGFLGIFVIVMRKIPLLSQIPYDGKVPAGKNFLVKKLREKLSDFKKEKLETSLTKFNERFLRRLRILALKLENISSERLRKMQEKSKKAEKIKNDKIWEKIEALKDTIKKRKV